MPTLIPLRARTSLIYGNQRVAPGRVFRASPLDAAALVYQQRAEFLTVQTTPAADAPDLRRRYRRRDLEAER